MTTGTACSHNLKSELMERIYFLTTLKSKVLEQIYFHTTLKSGVLWIIDLDEKYFAYNSFSDPGMSAFRESSPK